MKLCYSLVYSAQNMDIPAATHQVDYRRGTLSTDTTSQFIHVNKGH